MVRSIQCRVGDRVGRERIKRTVLLARNYHRNTLNVLAELTVLQHHWHQEAESI
jgi:hypothetical protein